MGTLRYLLLQSKQVQSSTCGQRQRMVQVMGAQIRLRICTKTPRPRAGEGQG